ncbi:hypothetical protein BKA57DRAFT_317321 [Linnemannia elongata]|nr:hypothetical protein BKA57DRAFT_317321 [Linnemannia elongata]
MRGRMCDGRRRSRRLKRCDERKGSETRMRDGLVGGRRARESKERTKKEVKEKVLASVFSLVFFVGRERSAMARRKKKEDAKTTSPHIGSCSTHNGLKNKVHEGTQRQNTCEKFKTHRKKKKKKKKKRSSQWTPPFVFSFSLWSMVCRYVCLNISKVY